MKNVLQLEDDDIKAAIMTYCLNELGYKKATDVRLTCDPGTSSPGDTGGFAATVVVEAKPAVKMPGRAE